MARIIDGKEIAKEVRRRIGEEVALLAKQGRRIPGLTVVLVGSDPASQVYVRNKTKACAEAGIKGRQIDLPANTPEDKLIGLVKELNADDSVDGILVQLPLPKGLDEQAVVDTIDPVKDVDGFHPVNLGRLVIGEDGHVPCTPLGVMKMLAATGVDMAGKEVVVIGRSNIVGKPMSLLAMLKRAGANGTVTVCHSGTKDIASVIRRGDIVVAAIGKARFVTKEMVKPGAVVIDVGINRLPDGALCGDVDYDAVEKVAGAITPVPGGVGPMTIAMLLSNTLDAYRTRTAK